MPDILFIHIVSASFALLGGYAALFARKGSTLHGAPVCSSSGP